MATEEKVEALRELTATCISMLKDLHDNVGWDQLNGSLEDVLQDARDLGIIEED